MMKFWDSKFYILLLTISVYKFDFIYTHNENNFFNIIGYVEKMCVQNGYFGTKLHLLNGADAISAPEYKDIEDFRKRYVHKSPNV